MARVCTRRASVPSLGSAPHHCRLRLRRGRFPLLHVPRRPSSTVGRSRGHVYCLGALSLRRTSRRCQSVGFVACTHQGGAIRGHGCSVGAISSPVRGRCFRSAQASTGLRVPGRSPGRLVPRGGRHCGHVVIRRQVVSARHSCLTCRCSGLATLAAELQVVRQRKPLASLRMRP